MRIYSFIDPGQAVYVVMAHSPAQALAILGHEIGIKVTERLKFADTGMSLAVMFEPDMGYLVARPEEMGSHG